MGVAGHAAGIIIGNEVLTAKVTDSNGVRLIARLRECGIHLTSCVMIRDDVDAIVDEVCRARERAQWVFTSGGIGPTHDDVTVRAVALAMGRRVVRLPEMEQLIRTYLGDREPSAAALRLADAPEGSRLIHSEHTRYPVLACDDVYLLPGVPELFREQLDVVLRGLPTHPVSVKTIYLNAREIDFAEALDAIALARPHVSIGSYPVFNAESDYRVKITMEHDDANEVAQAMASFITRIDSRWIVRIA